MDKSRRCVTGLFLLIMALAGAGELMAQDYPPMDQVTKDYRQVISLLEGQRGLLNIWVRDKDGQMLVGLPAGYEQMRFFFAMTVASGENYAGLQAGDMYVYWRRYDKRLALIAPNMEIRSYGDSESRSSVKRLFTDRVLLDIPIVTMDGPSPVIDMDALLVGQANQFFGSGLQISRPHLAKVTDAKSFPQNAELAFEVPAENGQIKTLHYSISMIPENTGYKPRVADERIGYFTTFYSDYGKFKEDETKIRYVNRWQLEKADPSLELSPPKNPIVFYIEATTPVRYRRWVREGLLYWNKAFEKVGISNAIEVYYQDERSGAHMDKDPEDVRYNFIRWLSNNEGTAIGPSRVHPMTGQILDADVILTDGWIRSYWKQYQELMPEIVMEGFSPETLGWLAEHPEWDPRLALASPAERSQIENSIKQQAALPFAGHSMFNVDPALIGDDEYDGLAGRTSQINGMCKLSNVLAFDVALFKTTYEMPALAMAAEEGKGGKGEGDKKEPKAEGDKKEPKPEGEKGDKKDEPKPEEVKKEEPKPEPKKVPQLDEMPEEFIGPLVATLACHEVGHTLGLRHNFKASSAYDLKAINSAEFKGKKPFANSVMDYIGVNINYDPDAIQGDYTMIGVGPYDYWAIEYGYTMDDKALPGILSRVADPELVYATDEDTIGPDPLARQYDFAKEPLDYAKNQLQIVEHIRKNLLEKYVKPGQSWAKARKGYELSLALQVRSVAMMANWVGGVFVSRDHKGDKDGRKPLQVVESARQRAALDFVINTVFKDEAFGLTPEMLQHMTVEKWWDDTTSVMNDATWPIHDRIMGIQTSVLTLLMNPSMLRRVYDNEALSAEKDIITLPELIGTVSKSIWTELEAPQDKEYTAREPMISSLRRNLQRQYLSRMVDLTNAAISSGAANKPISNLAMMELRRLKQQVDQVMKKYDRNLDPYTKAHLQDVSYRIGKALEAQYTIDRL